MTAQGIAPALASIPPGVVTLADHETHAQRVLDANAWAYFAGGAGDEITVRANRSAWDALTLHPRVLQPMANGHTRIELLGRSHPHPIFLAPLAYQRMAHPDGELAAAYAAAAQGAGLVLSTQSSMPLEAVAQAFLSDANARDASCSGSGPLWFQLYWQHDRGVTRELMQRAEHAGYQAVLLTVDAPASGARDRERRFGFRLPAGISAVNLVGLQAVSQAGASTALVPAEGLCGGLLSHAPTWADVEWLAGQTRLPLLLKGVLHPQDARQAAALGLAGIVVSNHGGRTLDTAPATAVVLRSVVEAVASAMPVLVDGGIRRGTDVLKAMALGASAVLLGRPAVYGLANAGALGVAHVLRLLRDELEIAMALTGCATLAQANPALLNPR